MATHKEALAETEREIRKKKTAKNPNKKTSREPMTAYNYQTGEELDELTARQSADYLEEIEDDHTGTGAVDGAKYGYPGLTIYAL